MRLAFFIAAILSALFSQANNLHGVVTDENKQPLSFANVYVLGTTKGVTTNAEGQYQLELGAGRFDIVFQYIGYTKQIRQIEIQNEDVELNIALQPEEIRLREVVVSGKEDPAYAIIRNAIATRQYHYDQIENYKCNAYTKGMQRLVSAPDKIFGQPINFDGSLDSNNAGIIYLSESISELSFQKPDLLNENVISSKVSGDSKAFTWNRAGDFYIFDFYKNNIRIEPLSERVFISPISDNALLYYRYHLAGVFSDNGKLVNKIEVTPRRKNDPAFSGFIYIVDESWNIHSLDVFLTKQNQINFLDTLWIRQVYTPVQDTLWMQLSQRFEFNFGFLGIKAEGYFAIVYSDYEVNTTFSKKYFTNELLSVDEEANKKDSVYWEQYRPVPLTQEEKIDYARKDSLEDLKQSKEYLRKIDREANKFNPWDLVLGYNYQNSHKKLYVNFMPYIQGLQYNTVEGFNLKLKAEILKELSKERSLLFEPLARYGFSNKHFNSSLRARFDYRPAKLAYIELEGGRKVFQFNSNEPITEMVNTAYSLFGGKNYMKIFEDWFGKINHRIEIVNGLMLWANVAYERRLPLENTSAVAVKNKEADFEPNIEFEEHDAFSFSATLQYKPGQKFISRPYQKIALGSKWPTFAVSYRKSIPGVIESDLDYDFIEFRISDEISLGMFGNESYSVKLGTFLRNNNVELMDYRHFNGNQTAFGLNYRDGFQLLDYYAASTTNKYIEAHFQHNFEGFFFNKIPGFRKLKFQEVFGAHFIYSEDFKDYMELNIGIENILRVLRLDFVFSISKNHPNEFGVRIGLDFGQL